MELLGTLLGLWFIWSFICGFCRLLTPIFELLIDIFYSLYCTIKKALEK